jgi:hypothetical protein
MAQNLRSFAENAADSEQKEENLFASQHCMLKG